jgi:hypothetical protein
VNAWGWLFIAPVVLLLILDPVFTGAALILGAIGYAVLLALLNLLIGPKG